MAVSQYKWLITIWPRNIMKLQMLAVRQEAELQMDKADMHCPFIAKGKVQGGGTEQKMICI